MNREQRYHAPGSRAEEFKQKEDGKMTHNFLAIGEVQLWGSGTNLKKWIATNRAKILNQIELQD